MNPIAPAPHYPHVAAQVLLIPTAGVRPSKAPTGLSGGLK